MEDTYYNNPQTQQVYYIQPEEEDCLFLMEVFIFAEVLVCKHQGGGT